ncbi:efflux RND transporter periplasmic adaptor subunit [Ferrimonas senticii]|uniref:efflux RND transporter periplasmic adaptor subunit n=1 Tax=Ferrimonas senticii TaxID=394566 RepID=UPI00040AF3A3|nr:efflux RND transporter periplasmic adaptor subunit [Ferrimonas senticii]
MKISHTYGWLLAALLLGSAVPSYAEITPNSATESAAAATHRCPMHPDETGALNDRCSICNMFINEPIPAATAEQLYRCPMHPDETGALNDRCSICNMFINEPVPAATAEPLYRCPMHPDETGALNDRCSICNMFINEPVPADSDPHAAHNHPEPVASPVAAALAPLPSALPSATSSETTTQYLCPMHPHIVGEEGDTCPICGMDLEPVTVGGSADAIEVNVSGDMQQALAVRTAAVERGTLWRYLPTLGTVEYNQDAISHIHTRVTGWVEGTQVHNVGQRINKGELLYQLYSPELVTAQDDYLQALDYLQQRRDGQALLRKARLRLQLLGVDESVIAQLERTKSSLYRVPFYAPQSGIVSQLNLRDGMYIQPGETQIELVDLRSVWVIADVFENEQSWLKVGNFADVTAASQGIFAREGVIDYLYPTLDPVTRAMQVRIKLDNADEVLRPGSLVDVELYGGARRNLLIVPTEALIQTGRENRVVVKRRDDSFSAVAVTLGMISQGKAEVLSGLNEGDQVVVSGQFLLDSEASIQGSLRRLSADAKPSEHNH